jgi:transposase
MAKHPMGDISGRAEIRLAMIEFYYQIKNASAVAEAFKASRKTFYKWFCRFEQSGKKLSSLENIPKAPINKKLKALDFKTELNIKHLREKYIRIGKVKLQRLYKKQYGYYVS